MNQSAMAANHAANNRIFYFIGIPFLALLCVFIFGVYIKFACLYVVGKLWHMVDFAFIHHVVAPKTHLLYLAGSQINTLTWPQFIFVMNSSPPAAGAKTLLVYCCP